MFNGYHEPPGTSYNDLEVERGKKKWPCGNGNSIQSPHVHPQNHQSEIWCSKPPYIGIPNPVNTPPKCNCPSCYQLPENQSYQGDLGWHRSWLSRTYPVPASQDLVKLQANHWENTALPTEAYGETMGSHYVQEGGEKSLLYKPYPGLRHGDIYQPGVISSLKTGKRKEDFPKQDEIEMGHQARFPPSITNAGCDNFRSGGDRHRIDESSGYGNPNMESSRQQRTLGQYQLHPNRRTVLESFPRTVPSNTNQTRVPSVGHHNIKDNVFHSYIDQNIGKVNSFNANQPVGKDKHCRSVYQEDIGKDANMGQENIRAGVINPSAPIDYHGINFNRHYQNFDKDFQKYVNGVNPQYLPRNNVNEVIMRNCPNFVLDTRKDYTVNRKNLINSSIGNSRSDQAPPPKYVELGLSKSPTYKLNAKDCSVPGRISSDLKLVINPKESFEGFQKGDDSIIHFTRQSEVSDSFAAEKGYSSLPIQNPAYKNCRRPEHPYRDMQLAYEYQNGMINLRNDPVGINQEPIQNFPDGHNGLDAYPRLNNNFAYDGSCQQFHKMHNQYPNDSKIQAPVFLSQQVPQNFVNAKKKHSEKEESSKISHLESIRYEELCKNGTSKISPLRLLRKKKFNQPRKEDVADIPAQDVAGNAKSSTSPLDVRRFWATWAEEEEDNTPQTQMVVLDCHNIDPEQAGLIHLYNSEPIRAIQLDEGNLLDVKSSQYDAPTEPELSNYRAINFENCEKMKNDNKINEENEKLENDLKKSVDDTKYASGMQHPLGLSFIMDSAKETGMSELKPSELENIENGTKENDKQDNFKHCESKSVVGDGHPRYKQGDKMANVDAGEKAVLRRDDLEMNSPHEDIMKEINADFREKEKRKEERNGEEGAKESSSEYSDDSQTGDLSALPDLPTSEYRKNKFLDYSGDNFCNGSYSNKSSSCQVAGKDCTEAKKIAGDEGKCEDDISPHHGEFEIDELLKKLSDINFQSPGVIMKSPELLCDVPQKTKTDKKIFEKKEKKTKKISHKSSRIDQLTLQNISLTKPTIKFSIQKSHDLKISLKVLNDKKKYDKGSSDEDDGGYNEVVEQGYSSEGPDEEEVEEMKKNRQGLITWKLKGLERGKDEGEEDEIRKSRKFLKRKKIRLGRQHKTPVLKIKKNRYMLTNGCENEEFDSSHQPDPLKSSESESLTHGDFQVHETVDSAKIKLTFKRNKNGGGKKKKFYESDEIVDVKSSTNHSEEPLVGTTDLSLEASPNGSLNGCETPVPFPEVCLDPLKPDTEEQTSVVDSTLEEDQELNARFINNVDTNENENTENDPLVSPADSHGMSCSKDENDLKSENSFPASPVIVNTPACGNEICFGCPENENSLPEDKSESIAEGNEREAEDTDEQEPAPSIQIDPEMEEECENSQGKPGSSGEENCHMDLDKEENDENVDNLLQSVDEELPVTETGIECDVNVEDIVVGESKEEENNDPLRIEKEDEEMVCERFKNETEEEDGGKMEDITKETMNEIEIEDESDCITGKEEPVDDFEVKETLPNLENDDINVPENSDERKLDDTCDFVEKQPEEKLTSESACFGLSDFEPVKEIDYDTQVEAPPVDLSEEMKDDVGNYEPTEIPVKEIIDEHTPDQDESETGNDKEGIENNKQEPYQENINVSMEVISTISSENPSSTSQKANFKIKDAINSDDDNNENNNNNYDDNDDDDDDDGDDGDDDDSNNNNNDNLKLLEKETLFVRRVIDRRCSCEAKTEEQKVNNLKLRCRSKSLNINLVFSGSGTVEHEICRAEDIPYLDIPVEDIPLPPGDAPPGNCLNLEEYIKTKIKTVEDGNRNATSSSEVPANEKNYVTLDCISKKELADDPEQVCDEEKVMQVFDTLFEDKKLTDESEISKPEDVTDKVMKEETDIFTSEINIKSPGIEFKLLEASDEISLDLSESLREDKIIESCPGYSEIVDEVTKDVEIGLEESSFRGEDFYECKGLVFDEALAISDDMEGEKVSDDDKFRNIMQNCLENAKKFLSVGNPKLFSEEDLLKGDEEDNKLENHISKDVLLTSCEKNGNEDLVLVNEQPLDISVDFVPSFSSDPGSNLCSEILPVDNWPYLEEEVPSSPLRSKQEDPDLLSSCVEISQRENSPDDRWKFLNWTGPESISKSRRRLSVCVAESSSLLKGSERSASRRRMTIEGIGRRDSFDSEKVTDSDGFIIAEDTNKKYRFELERLTLKKGLLSNDKYSKKSRHIYHEKLKKRIIQNGERYGKDHVGLDRNNLGKVRFRNKSVKNSSDFKSSSWQPKVVLFRISKNMIKDLKMLPKPNKLSNSCISRNVPVDGPRNKTGDLQKMEEIRKRSEEGAAVSEKDNSVDRIRDILSQDISNTQKSEALNGKYGIKRKKHRFRNLHTKKRIVPDSYKLTKEDKSASHTDLVDSEESSPERETPKAAYSHNISTKSSDAAKTEDSCKISDTVGEVDAKGRNGSEESNRRKSSDANFAKHSNKSKDNKRKRESYESRHVTETQSKKERNRSRETRDASVEDGKKSNEASTEGSKRLERDRDKYSKSRRQSDKQRHWKCEVCGFSKSSERAIHIQSHPFHCQSCHLAFKAEANFIEHLTRRHKDIRNQHHCLLCELSFDSEKDYHRHLDTREHKHLESVEKNTINTLFMLLTGEPCPVLGTVESKPEWLPSQAGTVHFYHQATPLSLALQYLKLHRDKTSTNPIE